ncbi:MAG: 50S ribosomal protein L10 [Clostridia bacterium]|nr:50S ribosomal protein L10 [Clostridia bacterium]
MANDKIIAQKQAIVAELKDKLQNAVTGVLVDYSGINVADDTALRAKLREAGVEYGVVKNTLTRFAAKEVGLEELSDVLNGNTALAVSNDDVVAPAKVLYEFGKEHEYFTIKGGFVEGKVVSVAELEKLATMPSKEGLLCMLLYALNGNVSGLARALQAVVDQKNDGEEATA